MTEQIPQYLSNENSLKQAVSYETRKAIIRAKRDFGMKNYTGTDEENEKLISLLRSNSNLREYFEGRAGISNAARQATVQLREDADRNPPAIKFGFFRRIFGGDSSRARDEVVPL